MYLKYAFEIEGAQFTMIKPLLLAYVTNQFLLHYEAAIVVSW